MESEIGRLCRGHGDLYLSVPWIVCFLCDLQAGAVFQVPIEFGIVVEMQVNAVSAGAVEISRE
jgi:hypothetical protein